jgi:hypothetical protein
MNLECMEGKHTPTSGERREDCTRSQVFPDLVAGDDGEQEIPAFACVSK